MFVWHSELPGLGADWHSVCQYALMLFVEYLFLFKAIKISCFENAQIKFVGNYCFSICGASQNVFKVL